MKPFWKSRTLWGGGLIVGAWALSAFGGIDIPEGEQAAMLDNVMAALDEIGAIAGTILVLFGRVNAQKKLSLT